MCIRHTTIDLRGGVAVPLGGLVMACPKCQCKVTYQYDDDDDVYLGNDDLERCAACGHIFDIHDALDDDDDGDEYVYGPGLSVDSD